MNPHGQLPLKKSLIKLMAKQAAKVERAINQNAFFSCTSVVDTASQMPFMVIERSEFNCRDAQKNLNSEVIIQE